MRNYQAITKALSDTTRIRMLCALKDGELCVCQLIELVGLAPSTVSKHLSLLHQADLVQSRKEGRWVYYRLPEKPLSKTADRMTKEMFRALDDDEQIAQDRKQLAKIRCMDLEELCQKDS